MSERLSEIIGIEGLTTIGEISQVAGGYLGNMLRFLRESKTFPNEEVNRLIELLCLMHKDNLVLVSIDRSGQLPRMKFYRSFTEGEDGAEIKLPRNFVERVRANPIGELGAIVGNASILRDFWTGKLAEDFALGLEAHTMRAMAFHAEMVLTLDEIVRSQAGQRLVLDDIAEKALQFYPLGLDSLPASLRYPTPNYKSITGRDTPDLIPARTLALENIPIKLSYDPEDYAPGQ